MIANTPPATQTATISPGLWTAPATIEGVPKMPAPMMRPTMIAVASPRPRTCLGTASRDCSGGMAAGILAHEHGSEDQRAVLARIAPAQRRERFLQLQAVAHVRR